MSSNTTCHAKSSWEAGLYSLWKTQSYAFPLINLNIWAATWENVPSDMCAKRRPKSTCASTKSGQILLCPLEKEHGSLKCALRRFLSDCAFSNVQVDLNIRWAEGTFSDVKAHMVMASATCVEPNMGILPLITHRQPWCAGWLRILLSLSLCLSLLIISLACPFIWNTIK